MAVLETPWFMKTKTSDLGRVNKVFDERFQASVAQIEFKKRKSMMKLEEEMKNIKVEMRQIRTDVDFTSDLDEHGKQLTEELVRAKASIKKRGKKRGLNYGNNNGCINIPPELQQERERYLALIGRSRRRQMTMDELREMCYKCVGKETTEDTNAYIKQARLVLLPRKERVKDKKKRKDISRVSSRFGEFLGNSSEKDRLPKLNLESNKSNDYDFRELSAGGRVTLRSKSASSSARARKAKEEPSMSRVKSLTTMCNAEIETPREPFMTSVSV